MQQDNDLKHTILIPLEMLWHDVKQAVHAQRPSDVAEIK